MTNHVRFAHSTQTAFKLEFFPKRYRQLGCTMSDAGKQLQLHGRHEVQVEAPEFPNCEVN